MKDRWYKRVYNLALSIYSHIRHEDYVGAKHMTIELLGMLETKLKEENNEAKASS
jgi:hypothetical protein